MRHIPGQRAMLRRRSHAGSGLLRATTVAGLKHRLVTTPGGATRRVPLVGVLNASRHRAVPRRRSHW